MRCHRGDDPYTASRQSTRVRGYRRVGPGSGRGIPVRSPIAPAWIPDATLCCLGAGLLIWSGRQPNPLADLIGSRPLVAIGLITYSLYLWHWPIYVVAHYVLIRMPYVWESVLLAFFSFAAAYFSYRYVEVPFRSRRSMGVRRVLWLTGSGAAILIGIAGALILLKGL